MINRRLLQYHYPHFDYSKLNNKHYIARSRNKLLLNYYFNKTKNIRKLIIFSKKLLAGNWFSFIQSLNIDDDIKLALDITSVSKDSINVAIQLNKCYCGASIPDDRIYCSNKCSALFKASDENFGKKISNSLKKYYESAPEDLAVRHAKISQSIKSFNNLLSKDERSSLYRNKTFKEESFNNLGIKFPNIEILFNSEYYYKNKYLPVKCKNCGHEWKMTKTTTLSRHVCSLCTPKKKHKTQSELFKIVSQFVACTEDDNSFLKDKKEIDILVKEHKLCIEFNGLLPHSFGKSKIHYYNNFDIDASYHLRKTEECESQGHQLFHIFENEYMHKKDLWVSVIKNKLGMSNKIFARKCVLKEISFKESSDFLKINHLQGDCNSSVKLGLFYNEEMVAVMTFRKHRKYGWEIARFANKINFTVVGGADKLLKYFERNYNPKILLSYANRRWSQGNLYEKLGFTFVENTPPNYFYFKPNENILYNREKFQKHKLKNILDVYDCGLSEIDNMLNNGYRIIFDCGNKKYIKVY